jgi:DNA repair photolyase
VKRIAGRFRHEQAEPHIVKAELRTNLGHGNKIFVCSGCDLFASDVPDEYIINVINRAHLFSDNTYLFQTKNAGRFTSPLLGLSADRDILCTTIETNFFIPEIMKGSPDPERRSIAMGRVSNMGFRTMVTVEPIIDFHLRELLFFIERTRPEQVNIGADSGNNHLPEPPKEKIIRLITELEKFTKVVRKKNLGRLVA